MELIDVHLDSNFHLDFWRTLAELRGAEGRIGRDHFATLPWTVIILIPPRGYIHAALNFPQRVYPGAFAWQKGEDTEETYRAFLREFKNRGVPKAEIPSDWLRYYGSFERYAGKHAGLWKFKRFFDVQNVRSIIVPTAIEQQVIDLVNRAEASLGDLAYLPAPDGSTLDKWRASDSRIGTYADGMRRWPFRGMLGAIQTSGGSGDSWQILTNETIEHLQYAIASLEEGKFPNLPLDPDTICVPNPDFLASAGAMSPDDRELETLCIALRARLVRLMKWPHMADAVTVALDAHRSHADLCARYPHPIPGPTIPRSDKAPYDPITELESYLKELAAAFPWVTNDPFLSMR